MSLREEIRALARQMDEEDNAASDLWSWLPSQDEARLHHGDYWQNVQPDAATVMREAAKYLAALSDVVTPEQRRDHRRRKRAERLVRLLLRRVPRRGNGG